MVKILFKPQYYLLLLFIGYLLFFPTILSESTQILPNIETNELKYQVVLGETNNYVYKAFNITNFTQDIEYRFVFDENTISRSIMLIQGLSFTVTVTEIIEDLNPFNFLQQRKQISTQFNYHSHITRTFNSTNFIIPITDNITYWEERNKNTTGLFGTTYTVDGSTLIVEALEQNNKTEIRYNIHNGWATFVHHQFFTLQDGLVGEIEIVLITDNQALEVSIPFVNFNFSIPLSLIGVLVVVPVAFAGGALLAKLLKR